MFIQLDLGDFLPLLSVPFTSRPLLPALIGRPLIPLEIGSHCGYGVWGSPAAKRISVHLGNFYIVDLENFATASRRYTGDIHNTSVVGLFMTPIKQWKRLDRVMVECSCLLHWV